jgi:lipopolysaccharide export system protein LptC
MMDTRVLYITAVAVAALSGGYYYYSGKSQKLDADASRNMTYAAEKIVLTQTNEQGDLYVKAIVDRLEQDRQKQTANLTNLEATVFEKGVIDAKFYANKAESFNDNQKVVMQDQVRAIKMLEQGEIEFTTDVLTAFPKQNTIETDNTVRVKSPQAIFTSQGLKADLNQGQYDFFNIRGQYEP